MPDYGGQYNLTAPSLADKQVAALQLDSAGRLVTVNSSLIPGTNPTSLGKAEDAAHTTGDTGVMVLGVRNDGFATLTSADGDYTAVATNGQGMLMIAGASGAFNAATASAITKAEDAAHTTGDSGVMMLGVRNDTNASATSATGDYGYIQIDPTGSVVTKPYSPAATDWQYAAAASGIVNTTTAVTVKAAGGAGLRNYITGMCIMADALGAATELVVRDGAAGTVIYRTKITTAGLPNGRQINFPTPLKGTAATLLEIATLTASVTGAVYVNMQGYVGP